MDIGVFVFLELLAFLPLILAIRQKNYLSLFLVGFGMMGSAGVLMLSWDDFDGLNYQSTDIHYTVINNTASISSFDIEIIHLMDLRCVGGDDDKICNEGILGENLNHILGNLKPELLTDVDMIVTDNPINDFNVPCNQFRALIHDVQIDNGEITFELDHTSNFDQIRRFVISFGGQLDARDQSELAGADNIYTFDVQQYQNSQGTGESFDILYVYRSGSGDCQIHQDVDFPYSVYLNALDNAAVEFFDEPNNTDYRFIGSVLFAIHLALLFLYIVVLWESIAVLRTKKGLFY